MADNETLHVIRRRRSVRSYLDKQIKEEDLQAILEAGMHAPNVGNQAWHFTVVQDRALLRKINRIAKEAALQMGIEELRSTANN